MEVPDAILVAGNQPDPMFLLQVWEEKLMQENMVQLHFGTAN